MDEYFLLTDSNDFVFTNKPENFYIGWPTTEEGWASQTLLQRLH